eukprot:TRINITY_DN61186_c0_g1_i1.p1 TRINITY_DN61186_c0_g1~~TRINITY_DN61186_c0_g1_i1.p1  ORF type:complete len:336 (-),score=36.06 TRINITY_DN61186_c0_g1_i1:403-1314(-)
MAASTLCGGVLRCSGGGLRVGPPLRLGRFGLVSRSFPFKPTMSFTAKVSCAASTSQRHFAAISPRVEVDRQSRTIVISPGDPSSLSASCIFMHGLGDTAEGFASFCLELAHEMPHVRFVCPTAPTSPVTLNGGMQMTSWFDIKGLEDRELESCDGIQASKDIVEGLLEKEASDVGHSRCVLAGFSQGGALALYVGLQRPERLAGILSLSAYLPRPSEVIVSPQALLTPVLQCHGEVDPMVKITAARKTESFLTGVGIHRRDFRAYQNLGHSVNDEVIQDVRNWFIDTLPANSGSNGNGSGGCL